MHDNLAVDELEAPVLGYFAIEPLPALTLARQRPREFVHVVRQFRRFQQRLQHRIHARQYAQWEHKSHYDFLWLTLRSEWTGLRSHPFLKRPRRQREAQ